MKKLHRKILLLVAVLLLIGAWVFNRVTRGIVIATAHSERYRCSVRELPHARDRLAQFLRIGTGSKVYLCEVQNGAGVVSSFGFSFAGSYIANSGSIEIHDSHPDNRYDGYVVFHVGDHNTRCDFQLGDHAEWTKF